LPAGRYDANHRIAQEFSHAGADAPVMLIVTAR
jgi:hypothetical protein